MSFFRSNTYKITDGVELSLHSPILIGVPVIYAMIFRNDLLGNDKDLSNKYI